MFEVEARTVVTWLERFRAGRVAALADRPRRGRPRTVRGAAVVELTQCLDGAPEGTETGRTTWTRAGLVRRLWERVGGWRSERSVGRWIKPLGFVGTRPKLTLRGRDPQATDRETALQQAIQQYPDAPRFYEAEADVPQVPVIRGQYQRRGEQREVATPGQHCRQSVFAFLNVWTGDWHFWLTTRKRRVEFLACLHALLQLYPVGPILLFLDNARIHKSQLTQRWLAPHPRLIGCYLPAYTGQVTNPVEKVWWELKGEMLANYLHPSREAIEAAIHAFFATFNRTRAFRLVARHEQACQARAEKAALPAPAEPLRLAA